MPNKVLLQGEHLKNQGGIQWSTEEIKTELMDPLSGKRIYRKMFDFGLLPASAIDGDVAHGIVGLNVAEGAYMRLWGTVSNGTKVEELASAVSVDEFYMDAVNVTINVAADLSSSYAIVFAEYTKT